MSEEVKYEISSNLFKFIVQSLRKTPAIFRLVIIKFFFVAANHTTAFIFTFVIKDVVDIAMNKNITPEWEAFRFPITLVIAVSIAIPLIRYIENTIWLKFAPSWRAFLYNELFSYIQRKPYYFFADRHTGTIAQKISDIPIQASMVMHCIINEMWPLVIIPVIGSIFLCISSNSLIIPTATWLTLYFFTSVKMGMKCGYYSGVTSQRRGSAIGNIVDSITNYYTVRSFGGYNHEEGLLDASVKLFKKAGED